ncbi:FG-GAP repeat domain-containing protein [Calothrix sp. PCC 6303]|uniref:FG-GAP repeat domain-containing protein n=1 Tax=Calothrix sp. PCC 6303 TaxID=1170562 RepID=UPI0002A0582E|nr:VCBS repeat-containing protein [Calothrix sp. PCC 6303]AFZ00535.1 Na-Ca exchanger/integrin-beta4 [Calothrix sp. PCC 6303]
MAANLSTELNRSSISLSETNSLTNSTPQVFPLSSGGNSTNFTPVLKDTDVSLNSVNEDVGKPTGTVGTLISSLVKLGVNVTDTDSSAITGIAITAINTNSGSWFYSTDSNSWKEINFASDTEALVLVANDSTRIYFQAYPDFNGAIASALSFRAWDTTDGSLNGSYTNALSGNSAFSLEKEIASIVVNPINDAPFNIIPESQFVGEDSTLIFSKNNGNAIKINDIDSSGVNNFQVTLSVVDGILSVTNTSDVINIVGNDSGKIILKGSIDNINAVITGLDSNQGLIFKPKSNFNGVTKLSIISDDLNTSNNVDEDFVNINVISVNDAPSFVIEQNISIVEDAGRQQLDNWVKNISPGAENESNQTVQFFINTNNPALFAELPKIASDGTLTYRIGDNLSGSATVSVYTEDDGGTENGGINRSVIQNFTINVDRVNDAPVNNVPTSITIDEDSNFTFSNQSQQLISITDIDAGTNPIQVTLTAESGMLIVNGSNSVKIDGNSSEKLTLTGTVDNINNILNGLIYKPRINFNGQSKIDVITTDQGNTGKGDIGKDEDTINITINQVNDIPTFTKGGDLVVSEDAPSQIIENWAKNISKGAENEAEQIIEVIIKNDNNSLFAQDGQPAIALDGKSGTLSYKLAPNAFGTANVTVQISDGIDVSTTQTFTITAKSVNDAPSFILGENQIINEDAGSQTIQNWARNISKGAENESQQKLKFEVSNNKPNLFAVQPTVSNDGTLTYTPANNANGTATVTIKLVDDGGVENGGINSTQAQTFNIIINSVNDAPRFTKGTDIAVTAGAGKQLITQWAKDFVAGSSDEITQTVSQYIITNNSEPKIFDVLPSIDSKGNLTFTPTNKLDTPTTAIISVQVQDSGGTANGGVDVSQIQTFAITVNPLFADINPPITSITEGNSATTEYQFTVNLSKASTAIVTVDYQTEDETATTEDNDYIANSGTLTFQPGEISKTIKVKIQGDTKFEANQTFKLNLSNPNNVTLGKKSSNITIVNDDAQPVIKINNVRQREGNQNFSPFEFSVDLSNSSDDFIMVDYATIDESATVAKEDYLPTNGTLTFNPGETQKTIVVNVKGDTKFEENETFKIRLDNLKNASLMVTDRNGVGTIVNDEGGSGADFNSDRIPDLFWQNRSSGETAIWLMDGSKLETGIFLEQVAPSWKVDALGDMNGDGNTDLLWRDYKTGENAIWFTDGTKVTDTKYITPVEDLNWHIEAVADFDQDGQLDILWYQHQSGELAIWQMKNSQLSQGYSLPIIEFNWEVVGVADFDGDGGVDIYRRNRKSGENAVLLMDGFKVGLDVLFDPVEDLNWDMIETADFDSDGKVDILWRNRQSGKNAIWLMNGVKKLEGIYLDSASPEWKITGVSDFAGDGKLHIVWQNQNTGENAAWRLKDTSVETTFFFKQIKDTNWQMVF